MGIFRRRGDGEEHPGDSEADDSFPFLTVRQAARLRALARQTLAEHGIESEIHPDHLLADEGWRFGLHNLFATCRHTANGEKAWPAIVRSHIETIMRRSNEPPLPICRPTSS
jgi:hypothetical protein